MTNGVWKVEFDGEWTAPEENTWDGKDVSPQRFDYDLWSVTDGATRIYVHTERDANELLGRLGTSPL